MARFEATVAAPAAARALVADRLVRWDLERLVDTAVLLTSELVTNAVMHARSRPSVVVAVADGSLEIGVEDQDTTALPNPPPGRLGQRLVTDVEQMEEGGRGIPLVQLLSDEWGSVNLPGGKQVWFRLDAGWWSYRTACTCHGEDLERTRLHSGRYAYAIPGPWDIP